MKTIESDNALSRDLKYRIAVIARQSTAIAPISPVDMPPHLYFSRVSLTPNRALLFELQVLRVDSSSRFIYATFDEKQYDTSMIVA